MFEKLKEVEDKLNRLNELLSDPKVISNRNEFQTYAKQRAEIEEIVEFYQKWQQVEAEIEGNKEILQTESDPDLKDLAKEELAPLKEKKKQIAERLKLLLLPKDPNDERNTFLEIRAGAGGEEAALFVSDLFRMYARYAEKKGWRVEIMSSNSTGIGGFKEIIALINGQNVYSHLKYEKGVHRVQRVPSTEASGRIHTSAITVAVMPEAEDIEVQIEEKDIRVDVYRSSGPGGQSVNTTDSAVRVTHLPTGMVVTCQDEKSQHKNKAKALKVLRARLFEKKEQEQQNKIHADRKTQVGTGERSEKIRTYNFPQNRLTDHRIGLSLYNLDTLIDGGIDELVMACRAYFQAQQLTEFEQSDSPQSEVD